MRNLLSVIYLAFYGETNQENKEQMNQYLLSFLCIVFIRIWNKEKQETVFYLASVTTCSGVRGILGNVGSR